MTGQVREDIFYKTAFNSAVTCKKKTGVQQHCLTLSVSAPKIVDLLSFKPPICYLLNPPGSFYQVSYPSLEAHDSPWDNRPDNWCLAKPYCQTWIINIYDVWLIIISILGSQIAPKEADIVINWSFEVTNVPTLGFRMFLKQSRKSSHTSM